jgi:hypothetical protein
MSQVSGFREITPRSLGSGTSCGIFNECRLSSVVAGFFEDRDADCEDSVAAIDGIGGGEGLAVG